MIAALRGAWEHAIVGVGFILLGLTCFVWAICSLALAFLPQDTGRRVGRRGAMWAFRGYLRTMEMLGAWRLDLTALDALKDAGPLIIAPNHPCLLDAPLVVSRLPNAVCVMKGPLLDSFFLGPAARLARYVKNDSLMRLISRAGDELRGGGQLLLFPEGTRTVGGPVGPFTDAVAALSIRTRVPVQTVIIETDSTFLGKGCSYLARPGLPITYRARLGRRFEPPENARAFTFELRRYFSSELRA